MSLFPSAAIAGFARIAVERGVDRYPDGLTYAVPPALADLVPGERVIVPLGRGDQPTPGYVVERLDEPGVSPKLLKPIERRDDAAGALTPELLRLARWISGYYCAPIGMTLATMLPAAVKRNVGSVSRTMIDLAGEPPEGHRLSAQQQRVLDHLRALEPAERPVDLRALQVAAGLGTAGPIRKLIDAGVLQAKRRTAIEAKWTRHASDGRIPEQLTEPQQRVIEAIAATLAGGFSAHLLHGVTGAGKTEVYIRLIEHVVAAGRTALLLVPEISLTPQTAGRLLGRFPTHRVAILHSALTSAQRHHQWSLVAAGGADVIIGARSAVFAPVPEGRLGLIIVDEEHDSSYKQDQVPRYQGRDVAVRRAQIAAVPVVLGSATPSLESWHNATARGSYALHRLEQRAPGLSLPAVQVVDFAEERRRQVDRRVHLIGPTLHAALGETLAGGAQALILLNRRGYASYITCPDQRCGWVMTCDQCDVTMVYHLDRRLPTGGYLRCHHCLSEQRLPVACPDCGRRPSTFGFGTQRVEQELTDLFPEALRGETMQRVDSDTMRSARDYHAALEGFGAGRIRVLVGTQMIAKGLDYPGVALVGVINADTAINLPDFRASERTFQLVSQVAGRCGRGSAAARVIVQTFNPQAPAICLAARHDYPAFAARELADRRSCSLPPYTRMARIVLRDEEHAKVSAAANALAGRLRPLLGPGMRMGTPAPCPIARIAAKHRWQIELIAPSAAALQTMITTARSAGLLHASASMAVDVDPVAML